ncbi:hypothetical protein [Permianibacter aggregans]|uniref:Uncharacterized protein n=1 Tax=Permianibacter aggregans TaxID=1510150 RepID=A0A4R6UT17_9GAMM|nr:hypothetical protein [Permianibacter aggregans]QGX38597.1 hypothetical protein E2H98_02540 [Permianibacter aggregans]TDQ50380.1 hypothetical protein EV696_10261 [Permianibacter aggregans]
MSQIDTDWLMATMNDALSEMENLVEELEADPDSAEETLQEKLPAVYAKLNYAWHTRILGPGAIDTIDHDALVSFPNDFDL